MTTRRRGTDTVDLASASAAPARRAPATTRPTAGAAKEVEPPPAERPRSAARSRRPWRPRSATSTLTLDADEAPCTVNSFVSLAQQGYFDDTTCHRLTTTKESGISVLQCGDPTGTGTGGPGYAFDDELSGSETYPAGTLAMANAGPEHQRLAVLHRVRRHAARPGLHRVRHRRRRHRQGDLQARRRRASTTTDNGMTAPKEPVDIDRSPIS